MLSYPAVTRAVSLYKLHSSPPQAEKHINTAFSSGGARVWLALAIYMFYQQLY